VKLFDSSAGRERMDLFPALWCICHEFEQFTFFKCILNYFILTS